MKKNHFKIIIYFILVLFIMININCVSAEELQENKYKIVTKSYITGEVTTKVVYPNIERASRPIIPAYIPNNLESDSINDSKVDIEYSENKAYTKIDITDYGVGITKKDLPHIFERFYQSENALNESMGIGLSLAKSIIEKDNGKVFVQSNNNKTTFTIKYFKV